MTRSNLSPVPPSARPQIVIPQDVPVYEIVEDKGFFGPDDHLYIAGDIIAWDNVPNFGMRPLNGLAEENMREFVKEQDRCAKIVADKTGRAFTSYSDAYENSLVLAKQSADAHKGLMLLNGNKPKKGILGANKSKDELGISKVDLPKEPEIMGSKGKFTLGKDAVNKRPMVE